MYLKRQSQDGSSPGIPHKICLTLGRISYQSRQNHPDHHLQVDNMHELM